MDIQKRAGPWRRRYPSFRYVAPFVLFLLTLGAVSHASLDPRWAEPLWVIVFLPICFYCWPRQIPVWPEHWVASIVIGLGTFVLWIAPEVLIPGYRDLPLFSNFIVENAHSSMPPATPHSLWTLGWRTARASIIVPVVEELFWRGWMMRWLIDSRFERVKPGAYARFAFWMTALLFASEHGPYWDVGLVTGVIYNIWMIRSKSVADCVLSHAATNGALSAYVVLGGHFQYWQ